MIVNLFILYIYEYNIEYYVIVVLVLKNVIDQLLFYFIHFYRHAIHEYYALLPVTRSRYILVKLFTIQIVAH